MDLSSNLTYGKAEVVLSANEYKPTIEQGLYWLNLEGTTVYINTNNVHYNIFRRAMLKLFFNVNFYTAK